MLRRVSFSTTPVVTPASLSGSTTTSAAVLYNNLCLLRTRKRPKVGVPYIKEAQTWREEYQLKQQKLLADSLRAYVAYGNNKRLPPWDPRFKPFDREETDGPYVVMRYLMRDKLDSSKNHAGAVKRMMCNVGLLGPQITTRARWRSRRMAALSDKTTNMNEYVRDKTVRNKFYSD